MEGADSRSRNNDDPHLVACTFQLRLYPVKPACHTDDPRHILKKAPTGPEENHKPIQFRPEIAVICRALLSSGCGPGLAQLREPSGKKINSSVESTGHHLLPKRPDVVIL